MHAIKQVDIIFEAQQPIAHHSETMGNHAVVMQRKIRRRGGGFTFVAEITGDTMRNRMRRESSLAVMRAADMLDEQFNESALRLLFAGGMVTGRGDAGVISLDRYRELCELVPPIALFGGCADNRVIPGKLFVEPATVICTEIERYLPAWVSKWLIDGGETISESRTHIEEQHRVRMDPSLDTKLRPYLLSDSKIAVNALLYAAETAHKADDPTPDAAKSKMMPRTFERLAQGTLFFWRCVVECHSQLDVDTFNTVIAYLMMSGPRVGGKQGTGHGLVRAVAANCLDLKRETEDIGTPLDLANPSKNIGRLFTSHVAERKCRIREFFKVVNA